MTKTHKQLRLLIISVKIYGISSEKVIFQQTEAVGHVRIRK